MTNSIEELEGAEVILITGSNTSETHPVIAARIRRAVERRKSKLIIVDPRKIDLVRHSTLWMRQRCGSDVAWINGLVHVIIARGWANEAFIREHTEGFEAVKESVAKYTPTRVAELTGIPAESLVRAAEMYATANTASIVYSMGITQHAHGTDNVRALSNLALVTGQIGRPHTGLNPLRGQNNVQGSCDMGALPNVLPGYQRVDDPGVRTKVASAWGVPALPESPGLTLTELTHAAEAGQIKGLYVMGENPMLSDPDLGHVRRALEAVDFLVVQDIFPTETTELADVVLPAACFGEKDGTFTNTERRVLPVRRFSTAPGEALADWAIVQRIARAMGHDWDYESADEILREVNQVVPQYRGITPERVAQGEVLQWPCPHVEHPGTQYLHANGAFTRGKGLFMVVEHSPPKELPDTEYPFVLSTGRILFHYHTATMTRRTQVLPEYVDTAYVEVNSIDVQRLGVTDGARVRVASRRGAIELVVRETDRVDEGTVFIPFHFSEAAANVLTIGEVDPTAKIPELKVCAVRIDPA
jgi:formate dehydrogenase alpha subunit